MEQIKGERKRQDKKWGVQNHHPYKWMAILTEELGEANERLLKGDLNGFYNEMVHTTAVAVAILEAMERGKWSRKNISLKEDIDDSIDAYNKETERYNEKVEKYNKSISID